MIKIKSCKKKLWPGTKTKKEEKKEEEEENKQEKQTLRQLTFNNAKLQKSCPLCLLNAHQSRKAYCA